MTTLTALVETSRDLAATRSRHAKVARLAALLAATDGADLALAARWLTGETQQEGRAPLGLGPAQLEAARAVPPAQVAMLTLAGVDQRLADLADITGAGSKARRAAALGELFAAATAEEQAFLARLILGELRQGALAALVVDAIAAAFRVPVDLVRRALMLTGDIAAVAGLARTGGSAGLAAVGLTPLRPVLPMLAQPAEDLASAWADLDRPVLEYKLDGARVQIHKAGDVVSVFSRQGNAVTAAVPELVEVVAVLPARSLILDGETIALTADGTPLPFQTTMRRFGRAGADADLQARLPLSLFCFDCLYLDGETLLDHPTLERHGALAGVLPAGLIVPRQRPVSPDDAAAFLAAALGAGHEGIMLKDPAAPYLAGARGSHWRKLKQAHTLDLVVLAAEWGSGRRAGWLSNLHLGARDGDGFVMLGKTFKGLTDATLAWQTEQLLARETGRDGPVVWVRPELVVEIAFNELQQSPHYPAGLALRFARVKGYRADKDAAGADSIDRVRALFAGQLAYRAPSTG